MTKVANTAETSGAALLRPTALPATEAGMASQAQIATSSLGDLHKARWFIDFMLIDAVTMKLSAQKILIRIACRKSGPKSFAIDSRGLHPFPLRLENRLVK